eukprot:CAMPEP_0197036334 /NCGR_PEP_ID=MMETSP1384-20130603/13870_1 /TAXON_ID=29189 /ORGANISM="Ammonia sp." /LENGTH=1659 /DNA_ID=CAMNT_0042466507 /DNA_START=112 /DNA_END=5091 /DNA_ORIENTATION=+
MAINIIDKLNDDWWKAANEAAKWKQKFEAMTTLFTELTGNAETNVDLTCEIAANKKLPDLLKLFTKWLVEEKHVFTRIALLRFLPVLIKAMDKKAVQKHEAQLIETIMTAQWTEKKTALLDLVNPCLVGLWKKTGFELKSDTVKPFLIGALKHRGKESRKTALEFLAECTMYSQRKKQVAELCQDKELGNLIGKLASGDKEKEVKIAGCMLFHGLNESGVLKGKKTNKDFVSQYDALTANKRAKANLEEAVKQYTAQKAVKAPPKAGGDKEEKPAEEEKKEEPKKKKGKKGKGKAKEEAKEEPAAAAPAAAAEALGDDEKIEDGKKYKKVVKTVTKERPKPGSGVEYTKGAGGVIGPKGGADRKAHKNKKPKKFSEGQGIDAKMLEDNKKALEAVEKFKPVKQADAYKKLDAWIGKVADGLAKGTKIGDRLKAMEEAHKNLKKDVPADKWSSLYDSLITLAVETMGWDGTDSKNPMLVKYFLELIGIAMNNADCGKQSGAFKPYLSWALQRYGESKFEKHAAECLLATCYQFSPKVVFSYAEKLLFEPEDPKNDPFKNDKNWGPVVKFLDIAVTAFGVDNCYVNRVINIVHKKLDKARDKNAKDACYGLLTTLYTQLGKEWEDVLLSGCPKQSTKTLLKKFGAIKDAGNWKQLRCTKKESVPQAAGQEMEQYEEEVVEWVEVKPEAPKVAAKQEEAKPAEPEAAPAAVEEVKEEAPKEPTPEPEPEPTPPPPPGPLQSTSEARKYRIGKCGKKLAGLYEQSKPLDKSVIKEYDGQISPKKIDKNHPGIFNDSPGDEYKCGDMEKWKAVFCDKKSQVKKWKPIVASLCAWVAAFEGTKFFDDVYNCIDLMLYWCNSIFQDNPQPNVGKMFMDLWKQICESCAASMKPMAEAEGKMLLPIVANLAFGNKQLVQPSMELCDAFELIYHPAVCYKIYLTTLERSKSNQVKQVCMQRLAKCITDYGLVKCDPKKFSAKVKKNPYKDPKEFVKHFMKIYLKLGDKKTVTAAGEVLKYCFEVVGDKGFWKECKVKGSQKADIEKIVEDAEKFGKGKYRPPEKQWIGDLIKEHKRRLAEEKRLREAGGGGGADGDVAGPGGIADGGVQLPTGPLPGLEAAGFTPIRFTPSQLLALKYGPAPHQWKMHNFNEYVSRLPPAFAMDWDEFEQKKKTVSTTATAPYIKIGNVRIDVETGKPFQEITTNDGGIKGFASVPPNNGVGIGKTGLNMPPGPNQREAEEKQFLNQANKDDEIMADILGVERDNAEYFDTNNDGSSWLALYDVNGFDETDRQIQLIEMRNIYGVKTLQTWLHTGKNVTIVESSVSKLLSVLLPWLKDLINTETLLPDNQRYEQTYQILQLLKFCSRFATLKTLSRSELTAFFKTLLSSITYDNINALFGHNYKRILAEINDVLIKSILRTPPTETLCVLISLLKECDPTNDSQSIKQYADACCKLIYKVIKRYDRIICRDTDSVENVYVEIVKFFSTISFETWQMAEQQRRFPLKVMQMVIARLVWFCGNTSVQHLSAAIDKIQFEVSNGKNQRNLNDAALHQRDTYAKRLILNFIHACQARKLAARPYASQAEQMQKYEEDEDEKLKPHNIKQAQSSSNGFLQPSSAEYVARSTLQNVHDADREAVAYARDNKIDLNFALWVGMTGRNKPDYVAQY